MTKLINNNKLNTFATKLWDKISNSFVSKKHENLVEGKTILQDGYIDGVLYSVNNPNATDNNYTRSNTVYSGTSNRTIPVGQHVTTIVIGLRGSIDVSSTVTGINVGVVRKSDNTIIEYLHRNTTSIALENKYTQINSTRIVNVNINKKWNEEIYFIVGANGMVWQEPHRDTGLTAVTGGDNLRPVGSVINNLNRTNYIGKIVVLGKAVKLETLNNKVDLSDVANVANKIPRIGADGRLPSSILPAEQNGGVRTVNGQSPVNGNVTVLAEHIKYVNGQNTTVKGAIDNKINVSDAVVSSQAGKIVKLDGNGKINENMFPNSIIKTNQNNNFTKKNDFNFYAPTITRDFTIATFNEVGSANRRYEVFNNSHYVVTVHSKFSETSKRVDSLIVPIANAQVGDTVNATYFVINNGNTVIQAPTFYREYTVEDIDMVGCKCIRIQVNQQFNQVVGFGFSVQPKSVRGTTIGMAYATDSSYTNSVWSSAQTPSMNQNVGGNNLPHRVFPYKVTHHTTSEVVTRFELEKVTQMYPRNMIGEMKQLSYDGGNSLADGMNTWLKANGQAINSNDYPELYEKFHTSRVDADIEVTIPMIDSQVGYYYICAK